MIKKYLSCIVLGTILFSFLHCTFFINKKSDSVVMTTKEYYDKNRNRKIKIYIWQALKSREQNNKSIPLILFSHGTQGSSDNYTWFTVYLAEKGFLVVGVDHYNDTWYKKSSEGSAAVWERPLDITYVLNSLLQETYYSKLIDRNKIGAAGHSAGGYAGFALAGAIYKFELMLEYCSNATNDLGCLYSNDLNVGFYFKKYHNARKSYKDNRIKAVFAMDPALGGGIDKNSLKNISIPACIVGCKKNDFLSYEGHAYYYAVNIPNAKLKVLDKGEGHFIFIDRCAGLGNLFLKQICTDKEGISRENIHKEISEVAYQFFNESLNK